jgi:hypothetical protein
MMTVCRSFNMMLIVTTTSMAFVRFEVFTAVTMKNGVFWVVTPCTRATRRNNPEDTILHGIWSASKLYQQPPPLVGEVSANFCE